MENPVTAHRDGTVVSLSGRAPCPARSKTPSRRPLQRAADQQKGIEAIIAPTPVTRLSFFSVVPK
jgi:hypothetical protein